MVLNSMVSNVFAQTDTIYKTKSVVEKVKPRIFVPPFVIKTSPTAFLWGGVFPFTAEYRLMAEVTTGRRQSQQIAVSYLNKSLLINAIERAAVLSTDRAYKIDGWRIQYALKLFWIGKRKHAPYGFYFGPMVSYANARGFLLRAEIYRQQYRNAMLFLFRLLSG